MLHEYREVISKLKIDNAHFAKIFEKHNELDQKIADAEEGREHISEAELDALKKRNLNLKTKRMQQSLLTKKNTISKTRALAILQEPN